MNVFQSNTTLFHPYQSHHFQPILSIPSFATHTDTCTINPSFSTHIINSIVTYSPRFQRFSLSLCTYWIVMLRIDHLIDALPRARALGRNAPPILHRLAYELKLLRRIRRLPQALAAANELAFRVHSNGVQRTGFLQRWTVHSLHKLLVGYTFLDPMVMCALITSGRRVKPYSCSFKSPRVL